MATGLRVRQQSFTQSEQPHFMTLTVVHWIPEDSVCAITLPLIAHTWA